MIVTDTRFTDEEKALLASLIGRQFEKYRIDEYVAGTCESSFGIVGLFVGGRIFAFTAEQESREFFGAKEDIAVVSFSETDEDGIKPHLVDKRQVDWSVGDVIEDIEIYEDRQVLSEDGADIFEYRWIGGIVFKMPRTEIVVEPDGWIMESFSVRRGPGSSRSIHPADFDIDEEEREHTRAERQIVSLREWSLSHA